MLKRQFLIVFLIFANLTLCTLIQAEPVRYLDKVTLEGLHTLSANDMVKSLKLNPKQVYEPELSNVIKEQLRIYLYQHGYYYAIIEQKDIIPIGNTGVNLVYNIDEGLAGYISTLRLIGNRYFSDDKIKQLVQFPKPGKIRFDDLPVLMHTILGLYTSRGYLFAEVELDSLLKLENGIAAVIKINEGPLFKAENYEFSGNKVSKAKTLLRISGLNQTPQITPDVISDAEKKILNKPYIEDCSIIPLNGKTLQITVKETRMTKIEGVLGLTTNPSTKKRNLSGYLNLQFLNLWGTDRSISLDWRAPRPAYTKLELAYHESGLDNYPMAGDLQFQSVQQDSAWKRIKGEVILYYTYFNNSIGADFYSENLYPDSSISGDVIETSYYNASAFWKYTQLDYASNPGKGYETKIKIGWLLSKTDTGNKSYPVTEIDGVTFRPLFSGYVYMLGLHYREISNHKAKLYEQYKLGGFNSLRGYLEEAFSGWRIGWINNEFGYFLTRDSRLYALFDYGFVQSDTEPINWDLMGAGLGISVKTRLGVIGINYALSINHKRVADLNSGILHIGLISSF